MACYCYINIFSQLPTCINFILGAHPCDHYGCFCLLLLLLFIIATVASVASVATVIAVAAGLASMLWPGVDVGLLSSTMLKQSIHFLFQYDRQGVKVFSPSNITFVIVPFKVVCMV
jgi:hypothetical protein